MVVKSVALLALWFVAQASLAAGPLTDHDVAAIGDKVSSALTSIYPVPDLGGRYAEALSSRITSGFYRNLTDCALAQSMTRDLQAVHPDGHLAILCGADFQQFIHRWVAPPANDYEDLGFEAVELDPSLPVATIRSSGGWPLSDRTFELAAHAMGMAAHAHYVVLDLRNNPGGHGEIGYFLASYFFPEGQESVLLERSVFRDPTKIRQAFTLPYVPGPRLATAKLYILVNHATASAAEGFSFFMQNQKRAIVVGEVTAGAGNPATLVELPAGMGMLLPIKRVLAPDTDEGWDGTGVLPDVTTQPGEERDAAFRLIREDMAKKAK